MYEREIRIRPSTPEMRLPTITVGMLSAASLAIIGVPDTATAVRFELMLEGEEAKTSFDAVRNESNWWVRIDDGFLDEVRSGNYEIWFEDSDGEQYWSSGGAFVVAQTSVNRNVSVIVDGKVVGALNNAEIAKVENVGQLTRDVDGVETPLDIFGIAYEARMSIVRPVGNGELKIAFGDLTNITEGGSKMVTFEVLIDCTEFQPSAVRFGTMNEDSEFADSQIEWLDGEPDLTTEKRHLLAFRWLGGTLLATKQGEW